VIRAGALLLVAACTHATMPTAKTPDTYLRMERTECLGECPVYTLTLYADGAVRYDGRKHVPTGTRWQTADPQRIAHLMQSVERAPTWEYDPDRIETDQPGTIIVVVRDGCETRRIDHDSSDPNAPKAIRDLEANIDIAAGTATFMSGP
jgi:hypothetical protein